MRLKQETLQMQRDGATCHKYELDGAQRVHISAK